MTFLGAIGLTEDSMQLLRWMGCGTELARCVFEFEKALSFNLETFGNDDRNHREQARSMQQRFSKHVLSLLNVFDEAGNPFLDESPDLITLDTKNISDTKAIETLNNVERIGKEQYHKFVEDNLKTKKKSIFDTISTNKFSIFRSPVQEASLRKMKLQHSRNYTTLMCQCLDGINPSSNDVVTVDCVILHGAVIVNMLKPNGVLTFHEYIDRVSTPFIGQQLSRFSHIDIVWDVCLLKSSARSKRSVTNLFQSIYFPSVEITET